jgi:hypothetical protein
MLVRWMAGHGRSLKPIRRERRQRPQGQTHACLLAGWLAGWLFCLCYVLSFRQQIKSQRYTLEAATIRLARRCLPRCSFEPTTYSGTILLQHTSMGSAHRSVPEPILWIRIHFHRRRGLENDGWSFHFSCVCGAHDDRL